MRLVTVLIALLAVVLALGLWNVHSLGVAAEQVTAILDQAEAAVLTGRWDDAGSAVRAVEREWSGLENWWMVILDHTEMDNIEFSLARLAQSIQARDRGLSLQELGSLKKKIEHIPAKERVTFGNIL